MDDQKYLARWRLVSAHRAKVPMPPIVCASVNNRRYFLAEILRAEFVLLKRVNVGFAGPEDKLRPVAFAAAASGNHIRNARGDCTSSAPTAPFPGLGFSAGCSPSAAAPFHGPRFPAGASTGDDHRDRFIGLEPADVARVLERRSNIPLQVLHLVRIVLFRWTASGGRLPVEFES